MIQQAWVVDDLETAARAWHRAMGIGPFLLTHDMPVEEARYRGRPGGPRFSTAVAQNGELQVELVQQIDDAPSIYREAPGAALPRFHHVAIIADDLDAAIAELRPDGEAVASEGRVGTARFAFIDHVATLGCMVEIVGRDPMIERFFGAVRKAAERWDGDPATLVRRL